MKLLEEFNKVKAENKKCIVFVKSGVFYISLGIDAYILNHILKLKLTDMSNIKRVGIPINSIEKYIVYVNKMIMSSPKCCRLSIVTKILDSSLNSNKQI